MLQLILAAGAAIAFLAAQAGTVLAQGAPPLARMPMPPSASDPAPKEAAKPKRDGRKPASQARTDESQNGDVAPAARPKRAASAPAKEADRPKKYVPEEFDREGRGQDSRVRPIMNESGRPGMGMRF